MSKIKINNAEYQELQKHVDLAKEEMESALEDVWSTHFTNLYHNLVQNRFLDDLYEDTKMNFNNLFGTGKLIIGISNSAILPCASSMAMCDVTLNGVSAYIPVDGWVISKVILELLSSNGMNYLYDPYKSVQFKSDAKKDLIDLIEKCVSGEQSNYKASENIANKIENIRLSLKKILSKIEEFNSKYADLTESANKLGVKTTLAEDGVTILGIETSINIDGKEIKTTTSEALNAFYTYSNTTTNTEIATDYLTRTYGYDMTYTDIVKNANSFMSDTIESNLYSHEFIQKILPEYNTIKENLYKSIGVSTQVDLNKIESTLNNGALAGSVALFGGLLGGALVGSIGKNEKTNAISNAIINDKESSEKTPNNSNIKAKTYENTNGILTDTQSTDKEETEKIKVTYIQI